MSRAMMMVTGGIDPQAAKMRSRRRPPRLDGVGPDARFFAYSASTPQYQTHSSGFQIRIKLSTPHPGIPFSTGELVEGAIIIANPGRQTKSAPVPIRSLTLRVYFESRTLFWHMEFGASTNDVQKLKVGQSYDLVVKHELHRGLVPRQNFDFTWRDGAPMTIQLDRTGDDGMTPETSLPFSFRIPTRTRIDQCNEYPNAPRDLCELDRCPPPSLADSPLASVQWVAEAVLGLDTASTPAEPVSVDERLLKLSNASNIVTRIVFPVLPADSHGQDLAFVKGFGPDLSSDKFGAVISWEGKADAAENLKGRGGEWRTYTKILKLNEMKLMSAEVNLIAELSIPLPLMMPRSTVNIPLVLSLHLQVPPSKGMMSKRTLKEALVTSALVSLKQHTFTRGGKEIEPHPDVEAVRSTMFTPGGNAVEGGSASKPGLLIQANAKPRLWELLFDLQTDTLRSTGKEQKHNIRASSLTPSFRTPNIQLDYLISVLVKIEGQGEFSIVEIPVQLLTGESSELPSFEEATGHLDGRDSTVPPQYSA